MVLRSRVVDRGHVEWPDTPQWAALKIPPRRAYSGCRLVLARPSPLLGMATTAQQETVRLILAGLVVTGPAVRRRVRLPGRHPSSLRVGQRPRSATLVPLS